MESRRFPDDGVRTRKLWICVASFLALAPTTVFVWNYRFLNEPVADARAAATHGDESAKWQAVTVLLRDIRPSVEALRDIASGTGTAAVEARRALDQLHERTR